MTESQPRYSFDLLTAFCTEVFVSVGVPNVDARVTSLRLVEADLRGRTGHGLIRVAPYVDRIEAGGINVAARMRILHETPVSAQIDADNGLGQVAMTSATELAITKAQATGLAWVGTVHSNHAGAAGLYPALVAQQGLVGMYFAVANANGMAPWGGNESILGTNPLAIAIPAGDAPPFLLDIATTVASHGTIKVTAEAGLEMPVGWVNDAQGRPITDPKRADEGLLLPMGGYKGSGLNIAIGLLAGVLNGAAFGRSVVDHRLHVDKATNTGQAMLAMRPDLFLPADEVAAAIAQALDELRHSGSSDGRPLRLPGDSAARAEVDNRANGIPVPAALRDRLVGLGNRLGVATRLD